MGKIVLGNIDRLLEHGKSVRQTLKDMTGDAIVAVMGEKKIVGLRVASGDGSRLVCIDGDNPPFFCKLDDPIFGVQEVTMEIGVIEDTENHALDDDANTGIPSEACYAIRRRGGQLEGKPWLRYTQRPGHCGYEWSQKPTVWFSRENTESLLASMMAGKCNNERNWSCETFYPAHKDGYVVEGRLVPNMDDTDAHCYKVYNRNSGEFLSASGHTFGPSGSRWKTPNTARFRMGWAKRRFPGVDLVVVPFSVKI